MEVQKKLNSLHAFFRTKVQLCQKFPQNKTLFITTSSHCPIFEKCINSCSPPVGCCMSHWMHRLYDPNYNIFSTPVTIMNEICFWRKESSMQVYTNDPFSPIFPVSNSSQRGNCKIPTIHLIVPYFAMGRNFFQNPAGDQPMFCMRIDNSSNLILSS